MKGELLFSSTAICIGAISPAHAQTQAPATPRAEPQAAEQSTLEEIVVTAQRRTENLQSVPISVTALTADVIAQSGANNMDSLTKAVPSLNVSSSQRSIQAFIRGVGSSNTSVGGESAVSIYVDGVYMASPGANLFAFNNIERIEVLKGPQGTLYGRNATGGLIHVYTRDPAATPAAEGSVSYGSYDTIEGALYATTGLTDKLSANISYYGVHQGKGYGNSLVTGSETDRRRELGVRSKLKWEPTSDDTLVLGTDYGRSRTSIGLDRGTWPGSFAIGGFARTYGDYDTNNDQDSSADIKTYGINLTYTHTMSFATLKLLSAYTGYESDIVQDADQTPRPYIAFGRIAERVSGFQNEATLVGDLGGLQYTAGLFYYHQRARYEDFIFRSGLIPSQNRNRQPLLELDSYAAFAQGTYGLTDRTNLTIGLRYTIDAREFATRDVATAGNPSPAGTVLTSGQADKTYRKLTYRAAIDQHIGRDALVYLSYNRGFKSGIFNTAAPIGPAINPEVLDAYELGVKSELFGRTVRLNASAFHYSYKDIQLNRNLAGVTLLLNAASAKIDGADVEMVVAPRVAVGDLQLKANISYLDAEYSDFPNAPIARPNPPAAGGNTVVIGDLSGFTTTRSPKWTIATNLAYALPVGPGTLAANASYYHNSGFFIEPDNRLKQDAYDVVNAELSYAFGTDGRYRMRVFGKNLTDARYLLAGAEGSFGDVIAYQDPRTYGVGFAFKFGG